MKRKYVGIILVMLLMLTGIVIFLFVSYKPVENEENENAMEDSQLNKIQIPKEVTFPDKREFTEEELALDDIYEPEGKMYYGDDEEASPIHVTVENFEELYLKYNDWKICNELPYYLHTYFNLCTGNLDAHYVVTLVENTCMTSEDTVYVTLEATVDQYPDTILTIEYDKVNRVFGIKSDLGDYSLDMLLEKSLAEGIYEIEYEPFIEDDMSAQDTVVEVE